MKLSGNVLDVKRVKTDEFGNMFAHSCPGMPFGEVPQLQFIRKWAKRTKVGMAVGRIGYKMNVL